MEDIIYCVSYREFDFVNKKQTVVLPAFHSTVLIVTLTLLNLMYPSE